MFVIHIYCSQWWSASLHRYTLCCQTVVRRVVFVGVQFNVCVFTLCKVLHQKFVLEMVTFIFSDVKFCEDVVCRGLFFTELIKGGGGFWDTLGDCLSKFSNDAGFNSGFNLKDKLTVEFTIILSLTLIITSDARFHTKHHTELASCSSYYAALLPRRGPHIASHSVCPSVCLSVRPSRYRCHR